MKEQTVRKASISCVEKEREVIAVRKFGSSKGYIATGQNLAKNQTIKMESD
jgi:hypothetical protein